MKPKFKYIECNVTKFRFTPAKTLCRGYEEYQPEFADYLAKLIQADLIKTIENQSYKSKWKPLSPSYLEYKKRKGLSSKIWKASGNMVSSIYKINKKNKILIGVTASRKYPNSKRTLYEVARTLEYGTSTVPARPLFRPVINKYYKNMRRYWNKFLKQKLKSK